MAKLALKAATTSKLLRVYVQDSTGAGLTGLLYNAPGLKAAYIVEGQATATTITLATMTVGTWASGGFQEVDAANLPGLYEFGVPNAALTGGNACVLMLFGAANMVPVVCEIELDGFDYANGYVTGRPEAISLGTGPGGVDQFIEYEANGSSVHATHNLTTGSPQTYISRT